MRCSCSPGSSSTASCRTHATVTSSASASPRPRQELRELAGGYRSLEETAAWINEHGGIAFLAHPYWTGITPGTLELPDNVLGIEIYNAGCELEIARGLSAVHWDELLEAGRMCTALATDDSHHPGFDSGHAWTWVRAEERTVEAVLAALADGCFYGSAGPRIDDIRVEGTTVTVECSPCRAVTLVSSKSIGAGVNAGRHGYLNAGRIASTNEDGLVTGASLTVPPAASYARIEATDATGMKAWSNPFPRVTDPRGDTLVALSTRSFDLLVVGGGIIGSGVAAHAARAGLAVALVDAGDFGGATSSSSSKLIHGGLRYLRMGDVRLVREAHHERRVLSNVVAPHLVHRLPFLFPLYEGGPYRPAFVQSGILLYSALATSRLHWLVSPERAKKAVPQIRTDGLRSCALYADAWTNDTRLCLENVRAAADAGAAVANRAKVVAIRTVDGRAVGAEVEADGSTFAVQARCVINAAGPWVDHVRRLEDPAAAPSIRLSKGVHALVPLPDPWRIALTIAQDEVRVTFAVPWYGMLLLGTTDTEFDGEPGAVRAAPGDVETILREASVALELDSLRASRGGAVDLGRSSCAAGRRGGERQRATRDRLLDRPSRDAERRRRQAHDLPPHRARRARTAAVRARSPRPRQEAVPAARRGGARTM